MYLDTLRQLFRTHFGRYPATVLPLDADGSNRTMYRLVGEGYETAVGVVGPDREENRAFLTFSRSFRSIGLPVPEVYAEGPDGFTYLEEDLGETTLFDALTSLRQREGGEFPSGGFDLYRRVLEILPRFQVEGGRVIDYSAAYPRAAFDRQSMLWDLNYFKYHFLKLAHVPFNEQRLEQDFRRLVAFLLRADTRHFVYRDFQSRNIMIREGGPSFIDYQGGRRGALQYDVASLLYDAKAQIPESARERLLGVYLVALEEHLPVDRELFTDQYRGYVLIRTMQAMGAYGYRGFFERKPRFLQSVPPAIDSVEQIVERGLPAGLPELAAVLERIVNSADLRRRPEEVLPGLTVRVGSFGYRNGYPEDPGGHGGGFVFDCRGIHNPGRYAEFSELCGRDEPVVHFLEHAPEVAGFWEHVRALVDNQVKMYLTRGFTSLNVQFGCTGGLHRSVYFSERLASYLRETFPDVNVVLAHREEPRWPDARRPERPRRKPVAP